VANTTQLNARGTDTEAIKEETKDLVAQFSGTEELDALIDCVNRLYSSVQNNPHAKSWWSEFRDHTQRASANYRGREDIERFRILFREGFQIFKEHRDQINDIVDRLSTVIDNIVNDQYLVRLQESLSVLSDDLVWQDKDGNRYLDTEAVSQMASSVSDVLRDQFKFLALPRVHIRDRDGTEYILDNVVLKSTLPDRIDFHQETFASLDTGGAGTTLESEIYITAAMQGIIIEAPEIQFQYKGTISDSGLMSVKIPYPGARLLIDFVMKPASRSEPTPVGQGLANYMKYQFVRTKCHFSIWDMDIKFDKSTISHDILLPLGVGVWKANIIDRFESGIEAALNKALTKLGEQITEKLNSNPNPLSLSNLLPSGLGMF